MWFSSSLLTDHLPLFKFTNVPDPDASPLELPPFPIPIVSILADAAIPILVNDDPLVPVPPGIAASLYAAIESSPDRLFMFPSTNLPARFDLAGILFKWTFLNPFLTLLPLLVLLLMVVMTVNSSANFPMIPPFLIQPVDGGSSDTVSLPLQMTPLISAIVSSSTPLLPLILLLTSLGLMFFPFLTLQFVSPGRHDPSLILLSTLRVIPLPSAKCFPFHTGGHPLLLYVSHAAFYRQSCPSRLRIAPAGLVLFPAVLLLRPMIFSLWPSLVAILLPLSAVMLLPAAVYCCLLLSTAVCCCLLLSVAICCCLVSLCVVVCCCLLLSVMF